MDLSLFIHDVEFMIQCHRTEKLHLFSKGIPWIVCASTVLKLNTKQLPNNTCTESFVDTYLAFDFVFSIFCTSPLCNVLHEPCARVRLSAECFRCIGTAFVLKNKQVLWTSTRVHECIVLNISVLKCVFTPELNKDSGFLCFRICYDSRITNHRQ